MWRELLQTERPMMPSLLMIAPAPVIVRGDVVLLDVKFAEGMAAQAAEWNGRMDCILWEGAERIAFPVEMRRSDLPWGLVTLSPGADLPIDAGRDHDLVFASADMHETLMIAAQGRTPVVYTVEYSHRTRLDILALETARNPLRRLRRRLWLEQQERRRKRAFQAAAAIQSNGYPCARAYAHLTSDMHLYLDNRMTPDRFVTDTELNGRLERLAQGKPLRIVYSGRLDPMKGTQDLVPLAKRLHGRGFAFELDIFGDGILSATMREQISALGLSDHVRLHGNVDFASELVPWQRQIPDIFLSCHRQGDPSCTYIESMGCGLPIVGYANEMWQPLCEASRGGWHVPVADIGALADRIATLPRQDIAQAAVAAAAFARAHDFQTEFTGRMAHLKRVAARS